MCAFYFGTQTHWDLGHRFFFSCSKENLTFNWCFSKAFCNSWRSLHWSSDHSNTAPILSPKPIKFTHPLTLIYPHSYTHWYTHTLTLTHGHTYNRSHTHTHTHTFTHIHTHTLRLTLIHTFTYLHTYPHTHALTHIHSHTYTLTQTPTHSHKHSHTYSYLLTLTHSDSTSLTHPPTHSLTHSDTHSQCWVSPVILCCCKNKPNQSHTREKPSWLVLLEGQATSWQGRPDSKNLQDGKSGVANHIAFFSYKAERTGCVWARL